MFYCFLFDIRKHCYCWYHTYDHVKSEWVSYCWYHAGDHGKSEWVSHCWYHAGDLVKSEWVSYCWYHTYDHGKSEWMSYCWYHTIMFRVSEWVIVGIMLAIMVRVSEWLKLTPNEKYSVIPRRNKLDSMTWWWCPLYTRQAGLSWILIVLSSQRVDTFVVSLHPDTLSWFWANPSLLFLLNAVFLKEEHPLSIL